MSFDSVSLTIVRCSILFKNMSLIVSDVMISEKNKTLISIKDSNDNDFKFCFHKLLKNDIQRWKCVKKTCKSYAKLNDKNEMLKRPTDHNHENDSVEI